MSQKLQQLDGKSELYFSFGVIADIQYADIENRLNHWGTRMRYYRDSLRLLQSAIEEWKEEVPCPSFILQLGDIIDCLNQYRSTTKTSLKSVLKEIGKIKVPFHHVWGNHELANFTRRFLTYSALNTKHLEDKDLEAFASCGVSCCGDAEPQQFYAYHFSPFSKFRFIMVDTYDLNVLEKDVSSARCEETKMFLRENAISNPNKSQGTEGHILRFNGGFSKDQLDWLDRVLTFSDESKEKVVVFGHVPIHPESKKHGCLAWNYRNALAVLQSHKCVVCYLAGHDHDGGYCLDSHGIHHVTFEGLVESPPGSHAFGTMYVYEDRMILHGRGRTKSRVLHYSRDQ
ncbi:manganese-dependent ADP-ribose/CDP-alcohol diphosphatase isoform X2 [Rhinatrema bivittatum]|nr:manganese-dependent ADP-ribose/CDP-alcohol diphosphatase isoform X2 [Rhinatrema bivittatum]XP_029456104.1 manganese-dependent ADP-ribose/CDP-alcohol diphosphatase isoform X2 [Rhinatrema bivittatum]XP_029456105.1 manganese-dependent ADP-ribose/CDP-alcohol diphosphatase isoform X2 [Rhinatrema bivittatum]